MVVSLFKHCFKCGLRKKRDDFYEHPMMDDGKLGKCKKCTKKDNHLNRLKRIDYYRRYDEKRSSLPHRKKLASEVSTRWRKKFPRIKSMHKKVGRAVKNGKIIKPSACSNCGQKAWLNGHHPDYRKVLYVQWLCVPCHKEIHKKDHP